MHRPDTVPHARTRIALWITLGPAGCAMLSVVYVIVMFADLGPEALQRSVIAAIVLLVIGTPLFLLFSLKLGELAQTNRTLGILAAIALSVSVGGVVFDRAKTFEELFRAADSRLYVAKRQGRDRVFLTRATR